MNHYTIRQVSKSELPKLREFIDKHWKKDHALVLSLPLLDYQHLSGEKYNFLVAENNNTHEFDAIVGFISTGQFDPELEKNGDYWGAIWKIRDDVDDDELNTVGFVLWKKLFKLPYFKSYGALGISEIAKKIYIASRLKVSHYNHYYILNHSIPDFKIAKSPKSIRIKKEIPDACWQVHFLPIDSLRNIDVKSVYRPQKSINYLINKYAAHPIYHYRFLGIFYRDEIKSIWVTRDLEVKGGKAIRVIDVLGEIGGHIGPELQGLLCSEQAEYIDFLNYGIPESVFYEMGFSLLDICGETIIPNYFEPFLQENIRIDLAYKANYDYVAFKGDSDQDRPNIIKTSI